MVEITPKKTVGLIGTGILGLTGLFTALGTFEKVPTNHFGVKVTGGQVDPNILGPGYHKKAPWIGDIDTFNNNTVILETRVGDGRNTKDQNEYSADVRVHYNISPDAGVLAFHLSDMADDDGKKLLTDQMNKSMDAVVGQRSTPETLISPPEVLKAFMDQLQWRLKQNNIALKVDTVEMLYQYVGNDTQDSNGHLTGSALRLPVQLRIQPGKEVESMSGPSVPVEHLMIVAAPQADAPPPPAQKHQP